MSNLIIIPTEDGEGEKTQDSIKYNKDCADFKCLDDGTKVGECYYCNLSIQCRQIDILSDGQTVPMESHYLPVVDIKTGELKNHELFCTGFHDNRPLKERLEDDKVS
jgi:hypothetical protein